MLAATLTLAAEQKRDWSENRIYCRDGISAKLLDWENLLAELTGRNYSDESMAKSQWQHDAGAQESAFLRCPNLESRLRPDPVILSCILLFICVDGGAPDENSGSNGGAGAMLAEGISESLPGSLSVPDDLAPRFTWMKREFANAWSNNTRNRRPRHNQSLQPTALRGRGSLSVCGRVPRLSSIC